MPGHNCRVTGPSRIALATAIACGACSAPTPSCVVEGTATVLVSGEAQPWLIVADADAIYWFDSGTGYIRRRANSGTVNTVAAGSPVAMVVDDQWLYWVTRWGA